MDGDRVLLQRQISSHQQHLYHRRVRYEMKRIPRARVHYRLQYR